MLPSHFRASFVGSMIRLESVSKRFPDGTVAVRELSLEMPSGEVTVLIGPSGCGKTTLLRMVNRLIEPTSGRIFLDDEDVTDVDPVQLRRRIGYVIQQVGLFPHQTIEHNVSTVPRLLGWDKAKREARADRAARPRRPRSRAVPRPLSPPAVGRTTSTRRRRRALAADPLVLLMDEPFGAIDPITRTRLQDEFRRLQSELQKTVVFVTHDIEEAVKLGDRIAILNVGGVLEQFDTPTEVLGHPATDFVASFVGGDRGIKQLKVTTIDRTQLDHPETVTPDTPLEQVRQLLAETAILSVPVVDAGGALRGRVRAKDASGEGAAADSLVRVDAWVDVGDTLERALANTLLSDDGWIGVLDGEQYLGVLTPDGVYRSLRAEVDRG